MIHLAVYVLHAYLLYHILSGDRGLLSYWRINKELVAKQELLTNLHTEKLALEKQLNLLNNNNIDLDLLDELARRDLALAGEKEEVWIVKQP